MIVSPLAARMAAEAGIDLRSLQGSGPGGRIIKRDIEEAMSQPKAAPAQPAYPRAVEPGQVPQIAASPYRDEPASEIRKVIAKRLVTSLGPVPHFFLTTEIEMDRAAEMRKGINALDPDLKISINDIIIKCTAAALMQHPQVNASFQDKAVRYYEHADVGVAVSVAQLVAAPQLERLVAARRIRCGIDRNGLFAELLYRANHPASNFAAVGDKNFLKHRPNPLSGR